MKHKDSRRPASWRQDPITRTKVIPQHTSSGHTYPIVCLMHKIMACIIHINRLETQMILCCQEEALQILAGYRAKIVAKEATFEVHQN